LRQAEGAWNFPLPFAGRAALRHTCERDQSVILRPGRARDLAGEDPILSSRAGERPAFRFARKTAQAVAPQNAIDAGV